MVVVTFLVILVEKSREQIENDLALLLNRVQELTKGMYMQTITACVLFVL